MENTKVSWTTHTFNAWKGCIKVNECCKNCYAETQDKWLGAGKHWGPDSERQIFSDKYWNKPLHWDKVALETGEKTRVFVSSLSDVFEDNKLVEETRERLFELIHKTPNLIWMILTKRPENILKFTPWSWTFDSVPENVRLGVSIGMQKHFDLMWPTMELMCYTLGVEYFLSMEPLLEGVKMNIGFSQNIKEKYISAGRSALLPSYIIVGGESGDNARPMHPDWAEDIRHQCNEFGIKFHFKQQGKWHTGHHEKTPQSNIFLDVNGETHNTTEEAKSSGSSYNLCKIHKAQPEESENNHLLFGKVYNELID